jgi:hypothetical protein
MSNPSVRYTPLEGITPEMEADALCAVYRFLNCYAKRKAVETTLELDSRNDVRKGCSHRSAKSTSEVEPKPKR